jgi:hypothetical protein
MRSRRYLKVQNGERGLDVALGLNKAEHLWSKGSQSPVSSWNGEVNVSMNNNRKAARGSIIALPSLRRNRWR